jgi:hypothetical protein
MLGDGAIAQVLFGLATGSVDQAREVIAASRDLEEDARSSLLEALSTDLGPDVMARRLGDALRAREAPRHLVNECYRVSFYTGDQWRGLSRDPLFAYFSSHRSGRPLDKWPHYFPIYDRHLRAFRGARARLLEIGVYRGGGLELLRHYLGDQGVIVGIDIDQAAARAVGDDFAVEIGDQQDAEFLARVADRHGPFDIVIDDGGHSMRQQITSVEVLFPGLADGGVYIVEDCHTSYWPEYADPDDRERTFIGWVKQRIDDLHAYHHSLEQELPPPWATSLSGLHVYDSLVVLEKALRFAPFSELSGTSDYVNHARNTEAITVGLVAARDEARAARDEALEESAVMRAEAREATARLEAEVARTEGLVRDSQALIEEMRGSMSWRVTEPLRRLGSRLRR